MSRASCAASRTPRASPPSHRCSRAICAWWLAHRTDADGWLSYHCTWEAGEDDNPRLDPGGTGDGVIQGRTRPPELQAAMALSAAILRDLFCRIGDAAEAARWDGVARDYAAHTQALWDNTTRRFRDWDVKAGRWVQHGTSQYWQADSTRFSPLAFTAALLDLPEEQRAALREELRHYNVAPWRWWPSWSGTLCEAAAALGEDAWAAEFVAGIAARVYAENDRRTQAADERPTPGGAREYWPEPLDRLYGQRCLWLGRGNTAARAAPHRRLARRRNGRPDTCASPSCRASRRTGAAPTPSPTRSIAVWQ